MRLAFLWESYRPEFWYFEVIETTRRLLLTSVLSVIQSGSSQQAVLACLFSLAYIKLYNKCAPYDSPSTSSLAEMGQYQIFFTFFFALILQNNLIPGEIWQEIIGVFLIILNMGVILMVFVKESEVVHFMEIFIKKFLFFVLSKLYGGNKRSSSAASSEFEIEMKSSQ